MSKTCSKCGKKFPVTSEYFKPSKTCRDGFGNKCRKCINQKNKQYREANKSALSEYQKKYRENNKERIRERYKQYSHDNKKRILESCKKYRDNNKELISERQKKYYKNNKEYVIKRNYEYDKKNLKNTRARHAIKERKRRARKRILESTLTLSQWEDIKIYFNNRCAYCGEEKPLTKEHFIALLKGGEYTRNNILPVCKSCNSSKQDKSFFTWYPKQSFYSKEREKQILDFLNYKDKIQQLTFAL